MAAAKVNVYDVITARILESLARGVIPWRKPWNGPSGRPRNAVSGKDYRGINVWLLGCSPYASPLWLTFNQARSLGGCVRKGEKGTPVVFWKIYDDDDGKKRFVLRYYTVFNVAQCDGITLPKREQKRLESPAARPFDPIAACDAIVAGFKDPPAIVHGGGQACYAPALDEIRMPDRETFESAEAYYATIFHEIGHSTGAAKRLDREGVTDPIRFGSHKYAKEELVAEMTSAFLCGVAGIANVTLDNAAAYIANWSAKLTAEPRWIVDAAGAAQRAADHVLGSAAAAVAADDDESEAA